MPRAFFGNAAMTMMKRPSNLPRNKVVFKVDPKMTKHEIKEYLTKLYQVDVKKVNTMIYEGNWLLDSLSRVLFLTQPSVLSRQAQAKWCRQNVRKARLQGAGLEESNRDFARGCEHGCQYTQRTQRMIFDLCGA